MIRPSVTPRASNFVGNFPRLVGRLPNETGRVGGPGTHPKNQRELTSPTLLSAKGWGTRLRRWESGASGRATRQWATRPVVIVHFETRLMALASCFRVLEDDCRTSWVSCFFVSDSCFSRRLILAIIVVSAFFSDCALSST